MSAASDWLATFKQQLLADKKKSAVLGGLSLVLLVVVARTVFSNSGQAPLPAAAQGQAATAQPPAIHPAPPPATASAEPAKVDSRCVAVHGEAERPSPRVVEVDGMPRDLARDLFTTPGWSKFVPSLSPSESSAMDRSGGQGKAFWQTVLNAALEEGKEERKKLVELSKEVDELRLQSTVTRAKEGRGPAARPMAYISGRVVHEGDTLCGFSVVRIAERRVTLRKAGLTRELVMP